MACAGRGIQLSDRHLPSINLVTVVPIPWDSDEIVYHVGFQVDLVEQPNAILRNMRDGTYQVNYTVLSAPAPPLRPAATKPAAIEHVPTQTGLTPEILEILGPKAKAAIYSGIHGEDSGKIEWIKCVLDQMDGGSCAQRDSDRAHPHLPQTLCWYSPSRASSST